MLGSGLEVGVNVASELGVAPDNVEGEGGRHGDGFGVVCGHE